MISLIRSGSAFNGVGINRFKVISTRYKLDRPRCYCEKTNYVSFTDFCKYNFITKEIGRTLIIKKYLICQRLFGKLWVCVNKPYKQELLDYLNIEQIFYDAHNP